MSTELPKIIFHLDESLLKRLDDFRFKHRINFRSAAIRRLLEEALKKYEKRSMKKGG
jgi:metal-responsive CopG/Arc/MetJ family transcriptional regulator